MERHCEMCGGSLNSTDKRRKYCDGCREVRKSFQLANAQKAWRERAAARRKEEREELKRLRAANEYLYEEVIRLREIIAKEQK